MAKHTLRIQISYADDPVVLAQWDYPNLDICIGELKFYQQALFAQIAMLNYIKKNGDEKFWQGLVNYNIPSVGSRKKKGRGFLKD